MLVIIHLLTFPKIGVVYTRHRGTLVIESNGALIHVTNQGRAQVKIKLVALLKKVVHENTFLK